MRRRVFSSGFGGPLAALAILLVASAPVQEISAGRPIAGQSATAPSIAQQPTTTSTTSISISPADGVVADLLRQGHQFERDGRWGDALTHYENGLREFPKDASLKRRFDYSRLHYDLGRRYTDRSFLRAVAELPSSRALDLYGQVLLKVEAHYVEVANWKSLVERGTNNLEVALSESAFVEHNVPEGKRNAAADFRRELRRTLGPRVIRSRDDARSAVAIAAGLAQSRLGILPTAVILEYLCGATNALDPYSAYLTPDQLTEVYSQIEGNFIGLGIELKAGNAGLLIVRVITGSPAELSGIRVGDRILSVDGQSTLDLTTDQAANLLQGDAGSVADLAMVSPGEATRRIHVRRQRVEVPSVDDARIVDQEHGIAYFRLACFQKTTCRDIDTALWKLHEEGMRSLIIDLRGNPGGLLVTAVEVVDKFVESGIIVSTRGRSIQEDFTYSAHTQGTWRVPLVVLIDQDSASAAEIFAGAIRDHNRGTIVGVRSFGKGSVQGIFPLDVSSSGVRLTTAKFYSPTGRPYSRVGVEPDVLVQSTARPIDGRLPVAQPGDDAMLEAAVQVALSQRQGPATH